jgi:hypothetical protein
MKALKNPTAFFKKAKFSKASGSRGSHYGGGGSGHPSPPQPTTGPNGQPVCVEIAKKGGFVGVRDSKDHNGPVLGFTNLEWEVFVKAVKEGEFD